MPGYRLLYLASLVTFTFGALSLSVLTLGYWRERRLRRQHGGGWVFPVFTVVCAAAFLINLLLQIVTAQGTDAWWVTGLIFALQLVAGLLPAVLLHLIYEEEARELPGRRLWPHMLSAFYAVCVLAALANGLNNADLLSAYWGDKLDNAPVLTLGAAAALGLWVQFLSRRLLSPVERRHRLWIRALLFLTLVCVAVNWARPGPFVSLLPDYLLLSFFCVTLYYKERPVFFDLLIKRGAFFAIALVGLILFFMAEGRIFDRFSADWSRPWICALVLVPFWLMGPRIYASLERFIDRVWLRRRYSPADAERQFVRDVQLAATEEELRRRTAESLSRIFQAPAEVRFGSPDGDCPNSGLEAELVLNGARGGSVILAARSNAIPYMSDDRRLLQSLAHTLSVVLENVRFREQRRQQENREQRLRWLASRAQLRALRAQINPHFLFNALNAIAGLIHDPPRLADETIEQLAEVFRYTLRASEKEWVRLEEELEFVAAYLRVEQARFGPRLHVEFNVDPAAAALPIPAMTIQPLVENAIRHGASAVEGRGIVGVRTSVDEQALWVEIFDNGPGFPAGFTLEEPADGNAASGHGLRNVVERLRGYYGNAAELRWEYGQNGTRVFLRAPLLPVSEFAGSDGIDARSDRG